MIDDAAEREQSGRIWHFVGDVYEWLESHPQISGVQRVALELMAAGCGPDASQRDGVCMLARSEGWLAPVQAGDALAAFAPWISGRRAPDPKEDTVRPPAADGLLWPAANDIVLFAGLVWTPRHAALFQRLHAFGIRFGVLVHDIIPLQRPDLVAEGEPARFADWLRTVLVTADAMLVSTRVTAEALAAWSRRAGIVPKAAIRIIPFGASSLSHLEVAAIGRPAGLPDDPAGFVLSVGTIDRRKNQALLLACWERLERQVGRAALPVLVFAGRPDWPDLADKARALQAAGKFALLDRSDDSMLAWAYRHCRFTAFPSLAEGYGLPVLESLAFGKTCLASDLPEIAETCGSAVQKCPPGDIAAWTTSLLQLIERPYPPPPVPPHENWAASLALFRATLVRTGAEKKMGGSREPPKFREETSKKQRGQSALQEE